jgi:transcription elongation factor Elf1
MLHGQPPLTYVRQSYITKIACPHCRGFAYLVQRSLEFELRSEIRTFECIRCGARTDVNFYN